MILRTEFIYAFHSTVKTNSDVCSNVVLQFVLCKTGLRKGVLPSYIFQLDLWQVQIKWFDLYFHIKNAISPNIGRSHWPRCLKRSSAATVLLKLWVRIPPGAWMFACCEHYVLSGRGLCVELITRPEEYYRLWRVVLCDLETSWMRRPFPALGRSAKRENQTQKPQSLGRLRLFVIVDSKLVRGTVRGLFCALFCRAEALKWTDSFSKEFCQNITEFLFWNFTLNHKRL